MRTRRRYASRLHRGIADILALLMQGQLDAPSSIVFVIQELFDDALDFDQKNLPLCFHFFQSLAKKPSASFNISLFHSRDAIY